MIIPKKTKDLKSDHISICICTFKRPEMLSKTLEGVFSQITDSAFTFEVVVVDNDKMRSAEEIVRKFKEMGLYEVVYDCEPEQSISLARNRAIQNATGDLVAFIDDDEFPDKKWLLNLYRFYKEFNVDGVLGPVLPYFNNAVSKWIIDGKFCERERFKSGTVLNNSRFTRTGNVLLSRRAFENDDEPFDPKFGRIGGGDADYFRRKIEQGYVFCWCDEAIVFENVPTERQKRSYFIKRAFTRGLANSKQESIISLNTIKSICAVCIYSSSLPILVFLGHHLFMKCLINNCDHLSKLLAYTGINIIKARPY